MDENELAVQTEQEVREGDGGLDEKSRGMNGDAVEAGNVEAVEAAEKAEGAVNAEEAEDNSSSENTRSAKLADEAKVANFTQLKNTKAGSGINNLDFVLEIPLQVSVHIGSARMLINDLLQMGQGSIIELDKFAGEPMDVLVNNRLIARGEVVVVNDKFGIRLTDIMSPSERIEQLK